jgi:hypothetical protein
MLKVMKSFILGKVWQDPNHTIWYEKTHNTTSAKIKCVQAGSMFQTHMWLSNFDSSSPNLHIAVLCNYFSNWASIWYISYIWPSWGSHNELCPSQEWGYNCGFQGYRFLDNMSSRSSINFILIIDFILDGSMDIQSLN